MQTSFEYLPPAAPALVVFDASDNPKCRPAFGVNPFDGNGCSDSLRQPEFSVGIDGETAGEYRVRPAYLTSNHLSLPMANPQLDAPRFVHLLATRMQDFSVRVDRLDVTVHIGVFRLAHTALHPFKGISSVHFHVEPRRDDLLVDYDICLTGLAWSFLVFGVLATAFSCSFPRTVVRVLGPPCLVAAVFALNWVWARFAVRRFLRRVGRDVLAQH